MTYFWVFYEDELFCTFERGFSGSEVPSGSLIYHIKGEWSRCINGSIEPVDADIISELTRMQMLVLKP